MASARPRGPIVRAFLKDAIVGLALFAYVVLVTAELQRLDRPVTPDSLWTSLGLAAVLHGARYGYERRTSGLPTMLVWGAGGIIGTAAVFVAVVLLAREIAPSVQAVTWLPSVLIAFAVVTVMVALVRHVIREPTLDGRRIALGEVAALSLVPLGLWLVTMGELRALIGIVMALGGPAILFGLQSERRRRGLVTERR